MLDGIYYDKKLGDLWYVEAGHAQFMFNYDAEQY